MAVTIVLSTNGHANVVKCLVDNGAFLEDHLYLALKKNQIESVKILLNADGVMIDKLSKSGFNVLHLAAKKNRLDLVKLFISNGADPNVQSGSKGHRRTALHLASENLNSKMVEFLLDHGADILLKDVNRQTALDLVNKGHVTMVPDLDVTLTPGELDPDDTKEKMCCILATKMKSLENSPILQENGEPSRKRPRIENGQSPSERIVDPLIDSFLDKTFPVETKLACFHAIVALVSKDSNILEFLIKKEVIDEIAIIVGEMVSRNENDSSKDFETIAQVLSRINSNQIGKNLIGEMKMSLTAFQKLQHEMKKFENNCHPEDYAFDSEHKIKKIKTDITSE